MAQIDDAVVLPAAYIDTGPTFPLSSAVNLNTAMGRLKSMSYYSGGNYADRVQMYVGADRLIADPVTWAPFLQAISRSGGVWFETYVGKTQWTTNQWLTWPPKLRDGLTSRGMSKSRLHLMVRGDGDQAAVWSNLRTGVACEFLKNGPGAYRITDYVGFVQGFRSVFGTAPAPSGPSPVTCTPAP